MIKIKKKILLQSFGLFLIACVLHFLYQACNENVLIGFIAPINESIFEHTKLIFTPLLLFYIFHFFKENKKIDNDKYFFTTILSLILGIILIPMIYYGYTESFNTESMIVDILITYVVIVITNIFFITHYTYQKITIKKEISIIIIIIIFLFYVYSSLNQINFPIFISK